MAQRCFSAYCVVAVYTDGCLDWEHSFGKLIFCKYFAVFSSADGISAMRLRRLQGSWLI